MKIFALCVILLATACVDVASDSIESPAGVESGGCRPGQQPVFSGHGTELVCDDVPMWPPAKTGSRAIAAPGCELADGVYDVTWTTDHETKLRPSFTYLKQLTIAGDHLLEIEKSYTSTSAPPIVTTYELELDWVDASSANVWSAGDTDTLEFVVWRDCVDGLLHGVRTVNLPYVNTGGPQVESWQLSGTL